MAITVWAGHAYLTRLNPVPAPLRPTLAIHMAPFCLFGMVCFLLGLQGAALIFGWLAILAAAVLLLRFRYLTESGFSPLWGAFTFPIAAFANLMLMLSSSGGVFRLLAGLSLIFGTAAILIIGFRIVKMWAAGSLAAKTNAARI